MSRNLASRTFSGRACSNNLFFLREQSVYLFLHTSKLNTQALRPGRFAKGTQLHGAAPAPDTPGQSPSQTGLAAGRALVLLEPLAQ